MAICDRCRKTGISLKCSRCHKVWYCNTECQKKSWREHRTFCKPFVLKESPGKGKGLFATKILKKGASVILEEPLMVCKKDHTYFENILKAFRGLTREQKDKVLCLSGDSNEVTEEKRARNIYVRNCISVNGDTGTLTALYPTISRINHSCLPNVFWCPIGGSPDESKKQVFVIREICPGEEILASYLDDNYNFETKAERQVKLLLRWDIQCSCELCETPNESDARRLAIQEHHENVPMMMQTFNVKGGIHSAYQKARLMESCDEFPLDLPRAYLELYEAIAISNWLGKGTRMNGEIYRKKALNLYKQFGDIQLLKDNYNDKVNKVADRYNGARGALWI